MKKAGEATLKRWLVPMHRGSKKKLVDTKKVKYEERKGRDRRTSSRTENRACYDNEHSYLIVVGRMTRFSLNWL